VVPAIPSQSSPNYHPDAGDRECCFADRVRQRRPTGTSPFGDCVLDDDVSGAVFERHLARVASYKSHLYSPGVVTGVLVYAPLAVYGYSQFLRSGAISIWAAAIAYLIGGSYHFWSAMYHGVLKKS
jgi:hypothetical protein